MTIHRKGETEKMSYTHKQILKNDMLLDQRGAMIEVMMEAQSKYCADVNSPCNDCEYFNETCDCQVALFAEALMNAGYGFVGE